MRGISAFLGMFIGMQMKRHYLVSGLFLHAAMWIHTRDCVAVVNAIHHRRCIYRWVSTIRVVTSVLILGERFSVVTVKMVLLR